MPVLPASSIVYDFPERFFVCLRSPRGDLLERVVAHYRCFVLSRCTPLLPQLLPLFYALGALGENILYLIHALRSEDFHLHSLMSSLKITACARRVIPFDIIMALEIVWYPAIENSLPYSNFYISQARG